MLVQPGSVGYRVPSPLPSSSIASLQGPGTQVSAPAAPPQVAPTSHTNAVEAGVQPGLLEVVQELLGLVLEPEHVHLGTRLDVGQ